MIKKNDRRIYDDEAAFVDRASWLDAHQIKEDRRKPRNIINENNHEPPHDGCCCNQAEEEV